MKPGLTPALKMNAMTNDKTMTNRSRLEAAIQGLPVTQPVFAVYDWFVKNRPQVDWPRLFALGLGQIHHANVIRHEHPNLRMVETTRPANGRTRRDVRWITDAGELHEWYLDFDGIDSFTPPPEGDMTVAEARQRWPDKMLWCHPPLGWYRERENLGRLIKGMAKDAGPRRFCLMISEDIPPDWERTVPQVLATLREANCQ